MYIPQAEHVKMINWKGVFKDHQCRKSSSCFLPNYQGRLNKGLQFIWYEIIQSIVRRAAAKAHFNKGEMKVPHNIAAVVSATANKARLMHTFCLINEENPKVLELKSYGIVSHRSPCGTVQHSLSRAKFATWLITVRHSFMINITIHKAYVPFSDLCSPDYLAINEGHQIRAGSVIEVFCGHILLESVYTKFNKGMLTTNPAVLTHLTASYQTHQ
jgi:hypothetical protein